jgi:DNA-binding MarR family transcriptional regulator
VHVKELNRPLFDFENQLLYWANRLGFLVRKEIHLRFKADGIDLRAEEMALLMQLWRTPGQTPSALADKTIRDRTTVTRFLDGMEKKDLVTREIDPSDRRRVIVKATKNSAGLQPKVVAEVRQLIEQSMHGISPEDAKTAKRVLMQVTNSLLEMRS